MFIQYLKEGQILMQSVHGGGPTSIQYLRTKCSGSNSVRKSEAMVSCTKPTVCGFERSRVPMVSLLARNLLDYK